MFEFLKEKTSESSGDNSSPAQPSIGPVAAATVEAAREDALKLSAESTKRRGRPRKNPADGGTDRGTLQNQINAEIAAQLDQVHDPKAWGALLAAPADVALTLTGRDYWKTSSEERATLGACGSAAARTMMITNPKMLAFFMLGAGLFAVYMPRLTQELQVQREAAAAKAKAAKEARNEQK